MSNLVGALVVHEYQFVWCGLCFDMPMLTVILDGEHWQSFECSSGYMPSSFIFFVSSLFMVYIIVLFWINVGILYPLIWLLVSLCMWCGRESSWVLRRRSSFLLRIFYHQLVTKNKHNCMWNIIVLMVNFVKWAVIFCLCSGNDVCNLWGKQGWRWLSIYDLQWREHIWACVLK